MNKTGNFLTELRKEKRFTQQEVADALNVSNKTVSKWERSEGYPEIETLAELAKLYHVSIDELISGQRDTNSSTSAITELLHLDFEKKRILSIGTSIIALLLFFGIYFFVKSFTLSFFIYLSLICLSFMFLNLGIIKQKKYHLVQKFIYFDWIRNFICLTIFTLPCFNFELILDSSSINSLGNYVLNTSFIDGLNFNIHIFLSFTNYLRILPILIFIVFLTFQLFSIIKNFLQKKPFKIYLIILTSLAFVFFANITYQVTVIQAPTYAVQINEEEYTNLKDNFLKIYNLQQKINPTLEAYTEGKKIDLSQVNEYLSFSQIEKFGNISNFDDLTHSVLYKVTFKETLNKISTSIEFTSILSLILLIINVILFIAEKRGIKCISSI